MKQGESRLREDMGKLESRLRDDTSLLRDDIKQLGSAWRGWSIAKPNSKDCWKGCARPSPDGSRLARFARCPASEQVGKLSN